MRRLLGRLCGALLAFATFAAAAAPAGAEPALWSVRKGASTVYLFGTVHVMKPGMVWTSPKIQSAFDRSSELWLEITDDDPATVQNLVETLGVDRAHPLSGKAPAADIERLKAVAKTLGAPGGEVLFEPMQPWFAALTITVAPIVAAGYDPQSGVDRVLKAQAKDKGKTLKAFETGEGQLHYLADLSQPTQVEFLESALDDFDKGPQKLDALVADWAHGDVAALERSEIEDMRHDQPDIYAVLMTQRNERFAARIAERLNTPGVSFVAIGAAHLAGPESVQAMLAKRGLTAVRE